MIVFESKPEDEALRIKRYLEELNQQRYAGLQRFYTKIWNG